MGTYEEITINMPIIESFGLGSVNILSPKVHNERIAPRGTGLINTFLAAEEFLHDLPHLLPYEVQSMPTMRWAYLWGKADDIFAPVPWHVNTHLIPGALIIRVKAKTDPYILGPFRSLLFGETILDDNETVLHEEVNLFGYPNTCVNALPRA